MTADLVYLVAGVSLLLAILLPVLLHRWAISTPMVLLAVGVGLGLTPLPDGLPLDPASNRALIEHVTELAVIISLMGVGLALDRPLNLRQWSSWRRWGPTWRMLGLAMPLTIGMVAVLGLGLGIGLASALLLGAVLAPTDPVLASDVQVGGPQTGEPSELEELEEPDELRFTLTSEAGLNDGLAFPFVYAAILVAEAGSGIEGWLAWFGWYAVAKVVIGVAVGILVGGAMARMAFSAARRSLRVAERGESLLALSALICAYGAAEVAQGYGFLAVFACAMTFRSAERTHEYHASMHEVTERLERLFTLALLLILGIALSRGLLEGLDWRGVVVGLTLIFLIRPLAGLLGLARDARLRRDQRVVVAFFGVRGIGSVYYLAYAAGQVPSFGGDWMWSTVAFTISASILVHGTLATPVLRRVGAWSDPDAPEENLARP